jgi:hypothetical protein
MRHQGYRLLVVLFLSALVSSLGCASLAQLSRIVQPPRFQEAEGQPAEIRLAGPSLDRPLGGATIRLWTRVTNPNPFGFRLSTLRTTLILDDNRAATGDFPLGLPLGAGEDTVVPLDMSISFADVAGLSRVVRSAVDGRAVAYELEGTVGIDAGNFGEPTFGPMTLFRGDLGGRSQ